MFVWIKIPILFIVLYYAIFYKMFHLFIYYILCVFNTPLQSLIAVCPVHVNKVERLLSEKE